MPTRRRGRTPSRAIRVPDSEWEAFHKAANADGETASVVARRLFRDYVRAIRRTGDTISAQHN